MSALSYNICLFFPVWRSCCNSVDCGLCSNYRLRDTELCLLWTLASMFVWEREYLRSVRVFVQKASVVDWDSVSLWDLRGQSGWVGGCLTRELHCKAMLILSHFIRSLGVAEMHTDFVILCWLVLPHLIVCQLLCSIYKRSWLLAETH